MVLRKPPRDRLSRRGLGAAHNPSGISFMGKAVSLNKLTAYSRFLPAGPMQRDATGHYEITSTAGMGEGREEVLRTAWHRRAETGKACQPKSLWQQAF